MNTTTTENRNLCAKHDYRAQEIALIYTEKIIFLAAIPFLLRSFLLLLLFKIPCDRFYHTLFPLSFHSNAKRFILLVRTVFKCLPHVILPYRNYVYKCVCAFDKRYSMQTIQFHCLLFISFCLHITNAIL